MDGAQGLDAAGWIVLSFGRRRGVGFLSDVRRLIVSLTRAQEGTIMVIHSAVANTQRPVGVFFRALREIARNLGMKPRGLAGMNLSLTPAKA